MGAEIWSRPRARKSKATRTRRCPPSLPTPSMVNLIPSAHSSNPAYLGPRSSLGSPEPETSSSQLVIPGRLRAAAAAAQGQEWSDLPDEDGLDEDDEDEEPFKSGMFAVQREDQRNAVMRYYMRQGMTSEGANTKFDDLLAMGRFGVGQEYVKDEGEDAPTPRQKGTTDVDMYTNDSDDSIDSVEDENENEEVEMVSQREGREVVSSRGREIDCLPFLPSLFAGQLHRRDARKDGRGARSPQPGDGRPRGDRKGARRRLPSRRPSRRRSVAPRSPLLPLALAHSCGIGLQAPSRPSTRPSTSRTQTITTRSGSRRPRTTARTRGWMAVAGRRGRARQRSTSQSRGSTSRQARRG